MRNHRFACYVLLSSVFILPSVANAECRSPVTPAIPDGATASESQLVATHVEIKSYQADLAEYRQCLDKVSNAIDPASETATKQKTMLTQLYNQSVDDETLLTTTFNENVQKYKNRH